MASSVAPVSPESQASTLRLSSGRGREKFPGCLGRLPSLTSLRWFAATIVFIRHSGVLLQGTSLESAYTNVGSQGASGVSFFFILSGFVLAWTYRPESPSAFYRRRFARIVPAYLVVIAVGLAYVVVFRHTRGLAYVLEAVFPVTLLQSWVPDPAIYFGNSPVCWSLSAEVSFYAVFPLMIAPVMRLSKRGLVRLMLGAATVSIAMPLVLHPSKGGFAYWAIYINPTYRLMEFVIGLCLAGLLIRGIRARIPITAAAALAVVGYLLAGQAPVYAMWVAVTLVPFAVLVFAFAEADLYGRTRVLHRPLLIRLGQWSFAFYLLHIFVVQAALKVADKSPSIAWHVALWIGSYLAAITAAYLLFRFVEYPLERRIRHGTTATPPDELLGSLDLTNPSPAGGQ